MKMPFGPHEGEDIKGVPPQYLRQLVGGPDWFRFTGKERQMILDVVSGDTIRKAEEERRREQSKARQWNYAKVNEVGWDYIDPTVFANLFGNGFSTHTATKEPPRQVPPSPPAVDYASIVRSWARQVAFENHPDRGGDPKVFTALMDAADSLKRLLKM
jgi:hypothetical protein